MRWRLAVLLLAALAHPAWAASDASISYFTHVRDVSVSDPERQNYAVVDAEMFRVARNDLGDLRLYTLEGTEVPYALAVQHSASRSTEDEVRVLQPGTIGGRTQFVLDVSKVEEYNRITLGLDARDFIAQATVEGQDNLRQSRWVNLGTRTLYDFTREKLGRNFTLRLPDSRFRYLRITLAGAVKPGEVVSAKVARVEEVPGRWTEIGVSPRFTRDGRTTVITWDAPANVPLERLSFEVEDGQENFRRDFRVFNAEGREVASGTVTRVRLPRAADSGTESLTFELPGLRSRSFRVVIENGDDPPLRLSAVRAWFTERRVYFDPKGKERLRLYYGDPELTAPVYDYAKFFRAEESAARAGLAGPRESAGYTGRPDRRPWSDRHPEVLWAALILAVAGLGALALRSLKT
ncbi:MAG TPA: DUF3999 family protein [Terriglobales bacterium]|nr:DUF3999 family protein [Terriglobales bacterium]